MSTTRCWRWQWVQGLPSSSILYMEARSVGVRLISAIRPESFTKKHNFSRIITTVVSS